MSHVSHRWLERRVLQKMSVQVVEEEGVGGDRVEDKKTTKPKDGKQERTRDRETQKERKKGGETGVEIDDDL